jgi:hypothetical protein
MAKTIEGLNLYCEFNRAWIDMYLNSWRWMSPFAFYYYAKEQGQTNKR